MCLPAACGNGRPELDEQCDDGDLRSHDGCSSLCEAESLAWMRLTLASPSARIGAAMAYDVSRAEAIFVVDLAPDQKMKKGTVKLVPKK